MKALRESGATTPKLSANDLQLKRFIELKAQEKKITKELKTIKETLKHKGSHTTKNYIVTVSKQSVSAYEVKAFTKTLINVTEKGSENE